MNYNENERSNDIECRNTENNEKKIERINNKLSQHENLKKEYQALKLYRPEVLKFIQAMEKEFKENNWKDECEVLDFPYLIEEIYDKVQTLVYVAGRNNRRKIISEAAAIGNLAMIIAKNFGMYEDPKNEKDCSI